MSNNDLYCSKCKGHHHPAYCPLDREEEIGVFVGGLLFVLFIVIIVVSLVVPKALMEVHTFNQLNNSDYSFKEWYFCSDAIKLQYAGKMSIGELR